MFGGEDRANKQDEFAKLSDDLGATRAQRRSNPSGSPAKRAWFASGGPCAGHSQPATSCRGDPAPI